MDFLWNPTEYPRFHENDVQFALDMSDEKSPISSNDWIELAKIILQLVKADLNWTKFLLNPHYPTHTELKLVKVDLDRMKFCFN